MTYNMLLTIQQSLGESRVCLCIQFDYSAYVADGVQTLGNFNFR